MEAREQRVPIHQRTLEEIGAWVVETCLDFGALPETAHQVAAVFVTGIRRERAAHGR